MHYSKIYVLIIIFHSALFALGNENNYIQKIFKNSDQIWSFVIPENWQDESFNGEIISYYNSTGNVAIGFDFLWKSNQFEMEKMAKCYVNTFKDIGAPMRFLSLEKRNFPNGRILTFINMQNTALGDFGSFAIWSENYYGMAIGIYGSTAREIDQVKSQLDKIISSFRIISPDIIPYNNYNNRVKLDMQNGAYIFFLVPKVSKLNLDKNIITIDLPQNIKINIYVLKINNFQNYNFESYLITQYPNLKKVNRNELLKQNTAKWVMSNSIFDNAISSFLYSNGYCIIAECSSSSKEINLSQLRQKLQQIILSITIANK